jgi:Abi-like protein
MANGQSASFQYGEEVLILFDKYLSHERLTAYFAQSRGDRWVAIRLYERNTELSEALYGVVQGLEVTLRNAIHNALTVQFGRADWYEICQLQDSERNTIDDAKRQILERPAIVSPGRIVAELNFSFWVRLFAHNYEQSLWLKSLYRIFPIKVRRKQVHDRLVHLKTLRNRIAHHERIIYKRDLEKDYADLMETIGWISPHVRNWIQQTNCFQERFARRIPKKPEVSPIEIALPSPPAVEAPKEGRI